MLLVVVGMEFDAEWNFPRGESADYIASFGVPQFEVALVVVEGDVLDCLSMSVVCSNASTFIVNFPDFHATIHAGGEEQVTGTWHQSNGRNPFRVTGPRVQLTPTKKKGNYSGTDLNP